MLQGSCPLLSLVARVCPRRLRCGSQPLDGREVHSALSSGPQQPAAPMAFIPPLITGAFILQVRTNVEPGSLMHAVQEQVWAVDRDEIFWVFDPLEDFLQEHTYATPEFAVMLSAPLAGIADGLHGFAPNT